MSAFQGVEFIKTELKAGLTFSRIALHSKDESKVLRNRANARKAYDTLLRFMNRSLFTNAELAELDPLLAQLKSNLVELGETV